MDIFDEVFQIVGSRFAAEQRSDSDNHTYRAFCCNLSALREYENRLGLLGADYLHCMQTHQRLMSALLAVLRGDTGAQTERVCLLDRLIHLQRHFTKISSECNTLNINATQHYCDCPSYKIVTFAVLSAVDCCRVYL